MSQENVEIVRGMYDAVNRGDFDAAFRDASPDFELTLARGLFAGLHRGRDETRRIWHEVGAAFASMRIEVEETRDGDDWVVAIISWHLQPQGSTSSFTNRNGHLWRFHEGHAVSMTNHPDPTDAFRAVGLSE